MSGKEEPMKSFEHWNQFVTETIKTMKQGKLPDDEPGSRHAKPNRDSKAKKQAREGQSE